MKIDKFESISMLESDLNIFKGGDRTLRFNHWHNAGSFVDENGAIVCNKDVRGLVFMRPLKQD
jgi:hypothetical protein